MATGRNCMVLWGVRRLVAVQLEVRVRHEVACLAVRRAPTRSHLPFCGQYPTKACATRQGGVRSPWDHVATSGRMTTEVCSAVVTASTTVVRS